jgi:NADH-quinone oxidoreductase subunit M
VFDNIPILSIITFSPIIGIILLAFINRENAKWLRIVGITTTFIPLILVGLLYSQFDTTSSKQQFSDQLSWINLHLNPDGLGPLKEFSLKFDYSLAVDGFSLPLLLLTAFIIAMAALASINIKSRWKSFYILFLLLEIGILGVFLAQDLLLFFVFFELTLVPMFFLIGIWGYQNKERAANRFLIYNGLGSALMLIAFLLIVTTAGATLIENEEKQEFSLIYSGSISQISENLQSEKSLVNNEGESNVFYAGDAMKTTIFVLLLIAFGIKLPIFPFHTWMLKVHAEAPPAVVMIHSGILLKMGAYGLLRFGVLLFPEQAVDWAIVLAILGAINIVYGALNAFTQKDFKLILAYSSVSHMGIILIGLAAYNEIGFQGLLIQLISHGLISALMFLLVGSFYERTQTTMIDKLSGLAKIMPFMSATLLFAGMALLGLPSLSGFVGELLAFMALYEKYPVITLISTLGIILAAAYVLRGVMKITYGPLQEGPELQSSSHGKDARLIEAVPMVALIAFIILIGVYPAIITNMSQATIVEFLEQIVRNGG